MSEKNKYLVSSKEELDLAKKRYNIFNNHYDIEPDINLIIEFEGENKECIIMYPQNTKIDYIGLKKDSLEMKSLGIDLDKKNFQTKIEDIYYVLFFNKK